MSEYNDDTGPPPEWEKRRRLSNEAFIKEVERRAGASREEILRYVEGHGHLTDPWRKWLRRILGERA